MKQYVFMHSDWQSEKNLSFDLGIFEVSFTAPSALPWPLLVCNPEDSPDPAWLCQCPGILCPVKVEGDSLQLQQHHCGLMIWEGLWILCGSEHHPDAVQGVMTHYWYRPGSVITLLIVLLGLLLYFAEALLTREP